MATNYQKIIERNLQDLFQCPFADLESRLQASKESDGFFRLKAFGEDCLLSRSGITFSGVEEQGPRAILVTLYAKGVGPESVRLEPFLSFKDLPGSMPYQGAFAGSAERPLIAHVSAIEKHREIILRKFGEGMSEVKGPGDFSLMLYPLPKIVLCYVFYREDEEFPASASCLFSANAHSFMGMDALADVAEYTTKGILEIVKGAMGRG